MKLICSIYSITLSTRLELSGLFFYKEGWWGIAVRYQKHSASVYFGKNKQFRTIKITKIFGHREEISFESSLMKTWDLPASEKVKRGERSQLKRWRIDGFPHGEEDCRYSPELAGSMEPPALHLYLMPCSYDQSVPFERRLKLWTKRLTTWVQRCSQTSSPGSAQSWWPKYHTYTLYCRRHHHPYRVTINTIKNYFWSTNMIIHPCIFPANLCVAVENVKSERQMSGERNGRPQYNVSTLRILTLSLTFNSPITHIDIDKGV